MWSGCCSQHRRLTVIILLISTVLKWRRGHLPSSRHRLVLEFTGSSLQRRRVQRQWMTCTHSLPATNLPLIHSLSSLKDWQSTTDVVALSWDKDQSSNLWRYGEAKILMSWFYSLTNHTYNLKRKCSGNSANDELFWWHNYYDDKNHTIRCT